MNIQYCSNLIYRNTILQNSNLYSTCFLFRLIYLFSQWNEGFEYCSYSCYQFVAVPYIVLNKALSRVCNAL